MKINGELPLHLETNAKPTGHGHGSGAGRGKFCDLLSQAVAAQDPDQTTAASQEVAPAVEPAAGPSPLWQQVNGLLDTLERYGQALGDPGKSLKEIEPLVRDLEGRVQRMQMEPAVASPDDPLAELAQQAMGQAKVAAIKFRRGDYL